MIMHQDKKVPAINFIRHIDLFYTLVENDCTFDANQIALYISLFRAWNENFFVNPFFPGRNNLIKCARLKSNRTFYQTLDALADKHLVRYYPPSSIFIRGTYCLSSFAVEDSNLFILVFALPMPDNNWKQIIPIKNSPNTTLQFKVIPGKMQPVLESKICVHRNSIIQHDPVKTPWHPDNDPRYSADVFKSISSPLNSFSNDQHHAPKQRGSSLRPSGIQPDPNADYSIPL